MSLSITHYNALYILTLPVSCHSSKYFVSHPLHTAAVDNKIEFAIKNYVVNTVLYVVVVGSSKYN